MAPERLAGRAADVRADQYSFCVTLREALRGEIPRRLRRALQRGLAADPAMRFPSMDTLAAELAAIARPRPWLALALCQGSGLPPEQCDEIRAAVDSAKRAKPR